MRCSMVWDLFRTKKEKPAAGKTGYWRTFWRRWWDSLLRLPKCPPDLSPNTFLPLVAELGGRFESLIIIKIRSSILRCHSLFWRRWRDSNPRRRFSVLHDFQSCALDRTRRHLHIALDYYNGWPPKNQVLFLKNRNYFLPLYIAKIFSALSVIISRK